ncbi:MAG TPA: adenylate/guanylate cyclase domain-containing protein [Xanthobacteraceae bacterium]|jgi:adenylate cyclase|nr:adenylate/guanylate cyclase domain-containing protein [Xanthobacteraceae bacterium]
MTFTTAQSVIDWLIDGARSQPLAQGVLTELYERLTDAGLPLSRVMVFVRTLHPEVIGRRFVWTPDKGTVVSEGSFELLERDSFRNSPMSEVSRTGQPVRRRLADPHCAMDYSILPDLRQEGVTDYLVSPLIFTEGEIHFVSWATQQPGGFTEPQLTIIEALVAPLARVAEVRAMRRVAANLLATYIGENSSGRVLAGQIRRGFTEEIHAAVWLSDMRGFTALADRLPPQQLVDLLNRYFDCQVPAILEHKGEVLKFMGDGLLAIFPTGAEHGSESVCTAALKAAQAARAKVAQLHAESEDDPDVRFGLALHLGDVLYGNIGSGNRLDFTCIGPAVNLAARLEKLAGRLGRSIVASRVFAEHCGIGLHPIGNFAIAGFTGEQTAYGLTDEDRDEE